MTSAQPPRRGKSRRQGLFAGLASLWTVVVLASLLLPGDSIAELETELGLWTWMHSIPNLDKAVHGLLFFGETFLLCLWWRAIPCDRPLAAAFLASALLACFTELAQLTIPRRSGDWADLAANHVGILLSALLIFLLSQHKKRGSLP